MDFADLLFFLIFVIIIISNVYKQMKKARPKSARGGQPVDKIGLKGALEMIMAEARKQMEKQAGQEAADAQAARPTGWEAVLAGPSHEAVSPEKPVAPEHEKLEKGRPEKAREIRQKPPVSRKAPRSPKPAVIPERQISEPVKEEKITPQPAVHADGAGARTDTPARPAFSRDALQNAVVWAEILAPPVGLRDVG